MNSDPEFLDPTDVLPDANEFPNADSDDQSPEPTIADLVLEIQQAKLREDALSQRADDDAMERLELQRALETEKQLSNQLSNDLILQSSIDKAEIETHRTAHLETQKDLLKAQRTSAKPTNDSKIQKEILTSETNPPPEKQHRQNANDSASDLSGTSGYNRLHNLGIFSNANTMDVHKAVSLVVNQSDFAETDPLRAAETNASSVASFIQYQFSTRGCKTFKTACENFEKVFTSAESDLDQIHSISSHFMKFLSETLSHISASRCFLLISTRKYIAGTQINGSEIETSRQVANVIHAYAFTDAHDTAEFDTQCSKQDINGSVLEQPLPQNPTDAPGIERLLSQTQSVKFEAWIDIISAVFNYLFAEQSILTREHEESLHSLTTNPSIHMKISKDGVVEPTAEWLSRYNALAVRLKSSAKRLGTPKIEPDDQERIKLAITTSPTELRTKLYSLFETDSRWTSVEFLKRPKNSEELAIPVMKFRDFETVLRAAYTNFKRYPSNGITKDPHRDPNSPAGQNPTDTKKKSTKGKCSLCDSPSHVAEDCSKRAGITETCNRHQAGKCRNGRNCKRLHTKTTPAANTLITGAPAPAASPAPATNASTNSVDTTNWTQCTCQDCQQPHMENADWWNAQTDHAGKPWGLPPRCKKCRAAKRAQKALSTASTPTADPATPAPTAVMPPGISLPTQSPTAPAQPAIAPAIPSTQMIKSSPYSSLDNQMDEEDEEDEYEELATCMVVASINPYSILDQIQEEDEEDEYELATCMVVASLTDDSTDSDNESDENPSNQEETPTSLLETARWEKRMKLKHEPHSEVAKLTTQNCTPAAPKRLSKPVDRLILSGSKLIVTGSDPILPDEMDAAFNDPDVSKDSIDLSDGDEVAQTKGSDPEQHSIKSFFRPAPPEAIQPIIEVEEECLCDPNNIFNRESTDIQCTRCFLCVKCCRSWASPPLNKRSRNNTDLKSAHQYTPTPASCTVTDRRKPKNNTKNNSSEDQYLLNQWIHRSHSNSSNLWAQLLSILRVAQNPSTLRKIHNLQTYARWCDPRTAPLTIFTSCLNVHTLVPLELLNAAEKLDLTFPELKFTPANRYIRDSRIDIHLEHTDLYWNEVSHQCFDLYRNSKTASKYSSSALQQWRSIATSNNRTHRQNWKRVIRSSIMAYSSRIKTNSIHRSWQDLAQSVASDYHQVPEVLLDAIRQYRVSTLPAALDTHSNHSYYQGFIAFIHLNDQYNWHQAMCCIDTLSQINMVSPTFLESIPFPWNYVAPPSSVLGAGGSTSSTRGEILIESYSLVYRGQTSPIRCTVIDIPDKIDLVLGLPEIKRLRLAPFLHDYRVYTLAYHETIRLDDLRRIRRRLCSAPWNILSLCGGIEPQISTLLELGIRIGRYYSIEFSVNARQTSTALYPAIVHLTPHNLIEFSRNNSISQLDDTEIHAIFAGFPCQSLSNNEDASSPDFTIHTAGAAIIDHITEANPSIRKFIENKVPNHRSYQTAVEKLDHLYHTTAQYHDAAHSGSPATRPCLYWLQPRIDLSTLPKISHPNPSWLLDDGFLSKQNPASRILASTSTNAKNYAAHETKPDREFTADERDRFNPGGPSGITNGFGALEFTNATRFAGSGNAFNMDELWQVLRHWPCSERVQSPRALSTVYDIAFAQAEAVELFYLNMTDTEVWQHMKKLAQDNNLTMPRLWIQLKDVETIPYQTRAPGVPPPRLAASADYCVDSLIRDGSHIEVEYSHEYWIALLFFKAKDRTVIATADGIDGTYKQGDELQAVRPLKDDRWINDAIEYPGHWAENSPDRHQFIEDIPVDTAFFRPYDAHNAYHACLLHLESRIYTVCTYRNAVRRRFIMPLGASQGLAPVGTFFPSWVNHGYNFFFGQHHLNWWRQFIDDCFAFAASKIRTDNRHRMMSCALRLMGLESSEKDEQELQSLPAIDCVGLRWTPKGICLPQAAVTYIAELLLVSPKSTTDARRIRGVILQSVSAFQFNLRDMGLFNRLMIPLNDSITAAETSQSKRLKWTPECEQAMTDMSNCFTNQPLAYHDPSWILSDTRCLAQIGDADPLAVTGYLVSVAKADARDITVEDLHDPSTTILIAFHPKILNKTQRRWHILEKEIYVHIHLHRKTHQLVNRCILPYGLRSPAIPKMLYVGDNKSALRVRMGLELPDSRCEYLTAKYQRAVGWAEEVAFTKHWPSTSLHMPGDSNNLADMSCRFAAMFADRLINPLTITTAPDSEDDEAEFESFPLTDTVCLASSLGVYFEIPPPTHSMPVTTRSKNTSANECTDTVTDTTFGTCTNSPSGYTMHIWPLTSTQWIELSSSYNKDSSEYNSVTLSDIFAVATGTYSGSKIVSKRVNSWLGSVFFLLNITTGCQSTVPVLFTPSATTKPALNIGTDYTTRLVMVIPQSSTLKLSSRTTDQEYFDNSHEEWAQQNKTYHDVLWLSHDKFTPHNSQATTISNAKRMAWWPGLEHDIQQYLKWCMLCSAQRLRIAPIGIGARCLFPLLCWEIDDKIITDENIIKNTGYVSILVCYELTSGITVLACRKTAAAWEVAHIIHTRVVQYYGVPLQILSDHAPAYIKEVGLTLCSIQGIPSRITCSKSSHAKGGESAIRAVQRMLETATAKGDLRSPIHLELYTASLQIKICQIIEADCSTAYERLFGFTPITTADLLQTPHLTEAQLLKAVSNTKNAANADYLKALHDRAADLISYRSEMSDSRAKYNWADRLAKNANKQQPSLEYSIDDEVSVDGSKWQVQRICTLPNGTPEKALLINSKGQCQWVRHDTIRPLSVPVPQPMLPIPPSIAPGSTIFYYDSSSLPRTRILCGDIQSVTEDTITVHIRQPNDTVRTYLPRWTDPAHTDKIHRHNYGKQKSHLIPFIDTTTRSEVICTTKLSDASMLDDETIYYLQSKGVDISIAEDQNDD